MNEHRDVVLATSQQRRAVPTLHEHGKTVLAMKRRPDCSFRRRLLRVGLLALAIGLSPAWSRPAHAQEELPERPIDDVAALDLAMAAHPSVRAAVLDLRSAERDVQFEEGRYPYTVQLEGGATRAASAAAGITGASNSSRDSVNLAAQLSRTFPTGTRATVRVDSSSDMQRVPMESGPTYGTAARASLAQPLMRGGWTTVGEQGLRIARINQTTAELARNLTASEVSRDVLIGYWELWYAHAAVRIENSARRLAKRQLDEAKQKIQEGVLPPVDALSYQTRLASLEESVLSARSTRRARSLELSQKIGAPEVFSAELIAAADAPPDPGAIPPRSQALKLALENSIEVQELVSQLRLAQERVRTAGDSYRPRLDLETYLQFAGAGYRAVDPVFDQIGRASAVSAHVGVVYELPLDEARKVAERAQAALAVRVVEERLRSARQQVQADLDSLLIQERAAQQRLALAEETSQRAEEQLEAEKERFNVGVGLPITIRQAQDDFRQANLRAIRAKVDVRQSALRRQHLTGELLRQIADRVAAADRQTR